MTKLSSNAKGRGENPVEDKHRSGPEIDHGRRRFAWLTLGTASTATLMSRSALGGTYECGSKSMSAIESAQALGKDYSCNGLGPSYWGSSQHADNWPNGMSPSQSFNSVITTIPTPAFDGNLRDVLRKRGGPQFPGSLTVFMNDMDPTVKTKFIRALKRCGPAVVASLLNAEKFQELYPLTHDSIVTGFLESWDIPFEPATLEDAENEVTNCRRALNSLRRDLERYYS